MKKILIVDDHIIVRQGVIRILQELLEQGISFHEASCGQEALTMAHSHNYDLVVLDLSLPDQNGLGVLKELHTTQPQLPVIVLSTYPEENYAVRALRAGASGYVNKGSASVVLKEAIESALTGRKFVTPLQADLLIEAISDSNSNQPLHTLLSDREYEFVCMMSSGKTLTEIARELGISVKTVSTYRSRVLDKLHLKTNAELIQYCIHNKLTT